MRGLVTSFGCGEADMTVQMVLDLAQRREHSPDYSRVFAAAWLLAC